MPQINICSNLASMSYGSSSLETENGEPIWRLYPVAASSLVLLFEWLIIDGRTTFSGIDVPFQLIHTLSSVF
jgi:hypothetical protein